MITPNDARARDAALSRVREGGADHALSVVRAIAAIMGDNELALLVSSALVRITEKRAADLERDFARMGWPTSDDDEPDDGDGDGEDDGEDDAPHASDDVPQNDLSTEPDATETDAGDIERARIVLADVGAVLDVWALGVPMRAELHKVVWWALTQTRAHIATVTATS